MKASAGCDMTVCFWNSKKASGARLTDFAPNSVVSPLS